MATSNIAELNHELKIFPQRGEQLRGFLHYFQIPKPFGMLDEDFFATVLSGIGQYAIPL